MAKSAWILLWIPRLTPVTTSPPESLHIASQTSSKLNPDVFVDAITA